MRPLISNHKRKIFWILSFCFGIALALSITSSVVTVSAENGGNIIMVDNYNDGNLGLNTLNRWTGWGSSGNFTVEEAYLHTYDVNLSKNNNARRMTYSCLNAGDYAWYSTNVWDDVTPLDITDFNYLSFRLKRETAYAGSYVKIQYGGSLRYETGLLYIGDYSQKTEEWQLVNIPLTHFTSLDKTKVNAIIFFFDNSLPVKAGTLSVDNLEFSKGYAKAESSGSVRIDGAAKTLLVNGEPFKIKSVGYQPYPIGTWPGSMSLDEIDLRVYDRDFPLLVQMGCNAVRTWGEPPQQLITKAEEYGLKVLAGFWIDPNTDYADVIIRESIKSDFRNLVSAYKNSPAILMWCIGNENNYHADFNAAAYYSLANELAEAAYIEEGASYHPVIIVNGSLYWMGVDEAGADDLQLNYIDAWGSNLYSRTYAEHGWFAETRDIFEVYKQKTTKPLVITEYGVDAYRATNIEWDPVDERFITTAGYEDETMQSDWDEANTLEIMASDVCLGSSLMEYSDEWWKDMAGSLWEHDLGGAAWWDGNQPDNYSNEEYYGIVRIAPDGTWSAPDGLDDIRLRQAYYALQRLFGGQTPPQVLTVDDYNDGNMNANTLGRWTGGNATMWETTNPNFDGSRCRAFSYRNGRWYASNLWDDVTYLDITDYEYLNFAVKGKKGGESFRVELQYGTNSVSAVSFSDTTADWQEVGIPLSAFAGLNKAQMRSISIVFYGNGTIYIDNIGFTGAGSSAPPVNLPPVVSDIPDQTITEGESFAAIALDDYVDDPDNADSEITWTASGNSELIVDIDPATRIATVSAPYSEWTGSETIIFRAADSAGKYDEDSAVFTVNPLAPNILIVDDYNDWNMNANSLGYWTGGNATMRETLDNSYDGTQCRRIAYSRSAWYSSNVWDGATYADVSAYNYLSFAVKGVNGGENFTITLYSGADTSSKYNFSGATTVWQEVNIPLSGFPALNKAQLKYIGITFKNTGTIYLDNLLFE